MMSRTLVAFGALNYMLSQNRSKVDRFKSDDKAESEEETSNFNDCFVQK